MNFATSPPGAQLVFDNNPSLACTTPCAMTLAPGRHTLTAELAGHRKMLRIFTLQADTEMHLALERMGGTLMIKSNPSGATVLINGQTQSQKTPAVINLPVGSHKVEVIKEGFRTYQEAIQIKDQVISTIEIPWVEGNP